MGHGPIGGCVRIRLYGNKEKELGMAFFRKIRGFLFLVALGGAFYWMHQQGHLKPVMVKLKQMVGESKSRAPSPGNYEFKKVIRKDIHQKVLATGTVTLKTGAEVKIGARISGQLEELRVKISDFVKSGDVIAVIEHEDLLARVARFKADLRAEEARLMKTRQEGPLKINKARAELEELQVQRSLADKMLERNTELNKKGIVSITEVEETEERVKVLKARIKLAEEELKLTESQLDNDVRLQEAMVEKAKANLQEEVTQLSYSTVTAPIDGIVAFISTQEGETVVASLNAPTFVTLIDLRKLEVTTFVDETDIGRVHPDQKVVFTVDSFPDKFFPGVIREIHPKAVIKDNVVNYEVIVEIDEKNISLLRPEMTANVVITTGTRKKVLAIPKEAVKRSGKKTFAMTRSDGPLQEKDIKIGWRDGAFIEVISGLEENEEVGIPIKPKMDKKGKKRSRRR